MKAQERQTKWTALAYVMLLALGLFSIAWIFLSQFGFPHMAEVMAFIAACAVAFAFIFLLVDGKKRVLILLGVLAAWVITGLAAWDWIAYGAYIFGWYITPYWMGARNYGAVQTAEFTPVDDFSCALFCAFVFTLYTALLAWAVVSRKSAVLALVLTVPVFVFAYDTVGTPPGLPLTMLVVFWGSMILQSGIARKTKQQDARIPLYCMAACAAVFSVVFLLFPQEGYVASSSTLAMREDIKDTALDISYSLRRVPGLPGGGPVTDADGTIDLNDAGEARFPDRDVMRVHLEEPRDLYLRGYSSSVYTGSEWLPDERAFEESGVSLSPLAYLEGQEHMAFSEHEPLVVTIEPDLADAGFLFTPYLYAGMDTAGEEIPEWEGDAYLSGSGGAAYSVKTYDTYGAVIKADSEEHMYLQRMQSVTWDTELKMGQIEYDGYTVNYSGTAWGPWIWQNEEVPMEVLYSLYQSFSAPQDIDVLSEFYPEENGDLEYLRYISEEYTALPDGMKETMLEWWAAQDTWEDPQMWEAYLQGGEAPYYSWMQLAQLVANEVYHAADYTTKPGRQPVDNDFVAYFLNESKEGYCVHFASATTTMLRALGVPARYVEGYVVRENAFGDDGWAAVPAKSAHAWTEIWMPGLGWVPVESTPSGRTAEVVTETTSAEEEEPSAEPSPEQEEETPPPEEETQQQEEESAPPVISALWGEESGPPPGWFYAVAALVLVAAVLIVLFSCHGLRRKKRQRQFRDTDPNKAALYIYEYLTKLGVYGFEASAEASGIAQKAKFSNRAVTGEELALLQRQAEDAIKQVRGALPRHRQFGFWLNYR